MNIPDHVSSKWVVGLGDLDLVDAEARLHADFRRQDVAEKSRRGAKYRLLEGPGSLVDAWLRWMLVNNEARRRGLVTQHLS